MNTTLSALAIVLGVSVNKTHAVVVEFTNKTAWEATASDFTTISFSGFPKGTLIASQYMSQGALFTDGSDYVDYNDSYHNDGVGLFGAINAITISFLEPMTSIAIDFPGLAVIRLYNDDQLVYTSNLFSGPLDVGHFGGLISTESFDGAIISGLSSIYIDDLHFGPPIPAPGALALLGAACLRPRRRRRA